MVRTKVEYATDNITTYRFCVHGCKYCWAWNIALFRKRIERGRYDPVSEARKYLHRTNRVIVVSFTADPYPPIEREKEITRKVLEVLSKNPANRVLILTKNPRLALRDLDLMWNHGDMWLGSTVIVLDKTEWEPYAPEPMDRLKALKFAKKKKLGIKTWLSIEPIIPKLTWVEDIVNEALDYVDFFVLGAFNYTKQLGVKFIDEELKIKWYRKHVPKAIELLKKYNKRFLIKRELRRYLQ